MILQIKLLKVFKNGSLRNVTPQHQSPLECAFQKISIAESAEEITEMVIILQGVVGNFFVKKL